MKEENKKESIDIDAKIKKFMKDRSATKKRRILKWSKFDLFKIVIFGNRHKNIELKDSQRVFDALKERINDNHDILSYNNLFENFQNVLLFLLAKALSINCQIG